MKSALSFCLTWFTTLAYLKYAHIVPHSSDLTSFNTSLTIGHPNLIDVALESNCPSLIEIQGNPPSFCSVHPGSRQNNTSAKLNQIDSSNKEFYLYKNMLYQFEGSTIKAHNLNSTSLTVDSKSEATLSEGQLKKAAVFEENLVVFTSKEIELFDWISLNQIDKFHLPNNVSIIATSDKIVASSNTSLIVAYVQNNRIKTLDQLIELNRTITHLSIANDTLIIGLEGQGLLTHPLQDISANFTPKVLTSPNLGNQILHVEARDYYLSVVQQEGMDLPFYIEYYKGENNTYEEVKTSYFKEQLQSWDRSSLYLLDEFAIVGINDQVIIYPLGTKVSQLQESIFHLSQQLSLIEASYLSNNQFFLLYNAEPTLMVQKTIYHQPSLDCQPEMEDYLQALQDGLSVNLELIERSCPQREANDPKVVCGRNITIFMQIEEEKAKRQSATWVVVLGVVVTLIMIVFMICGIVLKRRRMRQRYENLEVEMGRIQDRV